MDNSTVAGTAKISGSSIIGNYCVIGEEVSIGENVVIGNGVIIYNGTVIGDNVIIQDNAVIGKLPVKAKNSVKNMMKEEGFSLGPSVIKDNCIIGTSAILYRGSMLDRDCYLADQTAVRERVVIGEKTIIGRGVLVENDCAIGKMCKIEANAYITAHSQLGDYVFIAPGVVTTNDNFVGRTKDRVKYMKGVTVKIGGRVGANATILPGIIIEEDALVAAGSVVTKTAHRGIIVKGNPARFYRKVPEEQLLKNNLE